MWQWLVVGLAHGTARLVHQRCSDDAAMLLTKFLARRFKVSSYRRNRKQSSRFAEMRGRSGEIEHDCLSGSGFSNFAMTRDDLSLIATEQARDERRWLCTVCT
jgi:hypothetical protein